MLFTYRVKNDETSQTFSHIIFGLETTACMCTQLTGTATGSVALKQGWFVSRHFMKTTTENIAKDVVAKVAESMDKMLVATLKLLHCERAAGGERSKENLRGN